ncbi:MAG: hypothetical protein Q9M20_02425 [Mariprofundaceae bacterium]|nr:hypothetical protein [Mariprofundaceae bacterium]
MAKYIDLLRAHQYKEEVDDLLGQTSEPDQADDHLHNSFEALQTGNDDTIQKASVHSSAKNESLLADESISTEKHKQDNIKHANSSNNAKTYHSDNAWLNKCIQLVLLIFQYAQQNKAISITPLSRHLNSLICQLKNEQHIDIMDDLELSIAQQAQHIQLMDDNLGSLVQKSILMMLYAIKAGQHLKLHDNELQVHTLAAMLHHIGMTHISTDIRHKKGRLKKDELAQIKQAFQYGHDFLVQCKVSNKCILQAILQTPERFDGSGQTGLSGTNIAWVARLTSVLSIFEAFIHYRPYRARLLPRDAIREIVKHHKKSFDIVMLKALIESISLYPIGTYVQLNSKEIGLVIHIHPRLPLRPVVNLLMDAQGQDIPLRQIDLKTQPNLTIEKCMYKEAVHDLKSG